eukprot:3572631-Prorocentrum_lima.AAC.1
MACSSALCFASAVHAVQWDMPEHSEVPILALALVFLFALVWLAHLHADLRQDNRALQVSNSTGCD